MSFTSSSPGYVSVHDSDHNDEVESLWAFHESCASDNSGNECSSNGGSLSREVHLDNVNCFAVVFLRERKGLRLHCSYCEP